jgi:hypothetical protein
VKSCSFLLLPFSISTRNKFISFNSSITTPHLLNSQSLVLFISSQLQNALLQPSNHFFLCPLRNHQRIPSTLDSYTLPSPHQHHSYSQLHQRHSPNHQLYFSLPINTFTILILPSIRLRNWLSSLQHHRFYIRSRKLHRNRQAGFRLYSRSLYGSVQSCVSGMSEHCVRAESYDVFVV